MQPGHGSVHHATTERVKLLSERPKLDDTIQPPITELLDGAANTVASTPADAARLLREPDARALGREADSPAQIGWAGWRAVLRRTLIEMLTDRVSLVAAGCAFYGTLALFPAISMLISIYGLVFDPITVLPQLAVLQNLLPPAAYALIADRVQMLVSRPPGALTTGLLFSTAVTLWSSATGTKSILAALNLAYEEREERGFLRYQLTAFTITICTILGTVVGIGLLVALPPALDWFGFAGHERRLIPHRQLRAAGGVRHGRAVAVVSLRPLPRDPALAVGDGGVAGRDHHLDRRLGAVLVLRRAVLDV